MLIESYVVSFSEVSAAALPRQPDRLEKGLIDLHKDRTLGAHHVVLEYFWQHRHVK